MNVKTLTVGYMGTNCYILWAENGSKCLVIDPGYEPEHILETAESLGLTIEAILLTHGHYDHVGGVRQLAADTGCDVYLNTADCTMPPRMTDGPLYHTHAYSGGQTLNLAGLKIDVMATPGHTPGCVCLICEKNIFCGDTLFAGSCGRTDLPGGDTAAMRASLARLNSIEGNYFIYPGHGPASTLSEEKRHNPYLGGKL